MRAFHPHLVPVGHGKLAVALLAGSFMATGAQAHNLLSQVRLPARVVLTPVLEGVRWQGFDLEMAALDTEMSVDLALEQLTALLPEQALLSLRNGIAILHWEVQEGSVSLYLARSEEQGAVGVLTAMRPSQTVPAKSPGRSYCHDVVGRQMARFAGASLLFDHRDAKSRMRAYVLDGGIDQIVARMRFAMPTDGWTLLTQRATHEPARSVSLDSVCASQRLRLEFALAEGRTTFIAVETEN